MTDRDELARVIVEEVPVALFADELTRLADAILTSDWLAAHVRAKQAEALMVCGGCRGLIAREEETNGTTEEGRVQEGA